MNNDQFHRPLFRRATIGSNRRRPANQIPAWVVLVTLLTFAVITGLSQ